MNGCFWKSAPQLQISWKDIIPKFNYPFKPFSVLNFALTGWFSLFFYVTCFAKIFLSLLLRNTHQVRCYHLFFIEIIVESVNLMQMSKQNRKVFHHVGEHSVFTKKCTWKVGPGNRDPQTVPILTGELKWLPWQSRWDGFRSAWTMEHRKILQATMVGWQKKLWIVDALERLKQQDFDLGDILLMKFAWSTRVSISSEWL